MATHTFAGILIDDEQFNNLHTGYEVARVVKATSRDIKTLFEAVMQESSGRAVPGGPNDSVGWLQQRGNWGTKADRLSIIRSTAKFFLGGSGDYATDLNAGCTGLFSLTDRTTYSMAKGAQKVQRSAYPTEYAKWKNFAVEAYNYFNAQDTATNSAAK